MARALTAERDAFASALDRVVDSGRTVLGAEVAAFEREWGAYLGAAHVVGVASGTDAVELALRALEIGPGDEVVVPSFTAPACGAAVHRAGAELVLADVDAETLLVDPASVAEAIGPRTRAVLAVHLYGRAAPVAALEALGLPLVEDAAQAQGLRLGDRMAGTLGAVGCFSFYPTKNLGALGDAGAVATGSAELAERLRALRQYGDLERYRGELDGVNSRLDELQAAFLRARLGLLDSGNARRREIARAYDEALGRSSPDGVHHLYVVRARDRDSFRSALEARGIGTLVHYPFALHEQGAYASSRRVESLAASEQAARDVVSLPCFPELTDEEIAAVCAALSELRAELSA